VHKVYAVILVGGKGKRLRPLSSSARPKAFLSVTKDRKTMFTRTVDRIKKMIPASDIVIVANKLHSLLVKIDFKQLEERNLVLEPISRNTAPAIALAAFTLEKMDHDAIMVVLPADQYIKDEIDEGRYLDSIKRGLDFIETNDNAILVLGLRPTFPSTQFGYIKTRDKRQETRDKNIYKVERFVEKPGLATARKYVESKKYLWNTGTFIFKADVILRTIKRFAPKIYNGLKGHGNLSTSYKRLPDISIDYAVMEKAGNIFCVKGEYRWQDMGSFDSLKIILRGESRRFVESGDKILKIL